jgi:hypothetical protein
MRSTAARRSIPDRPGSSGSPSTAARLPAQRARPAAVDLKALADANVAIERERRRGRGAQSNASGRYEPLARTVFDDGWQGFEELPPFKTTVTIDSSRKIITRYLIRPLHQPLPRLRARLHLLLCETYTRLPRALARP